MNAHFPLCFQLKRRQNGRTDRACPRGSGFARAAFPNADLDILAVKDPCENDIDATWEAFVILYLWSDGTPVKFENGYEHNGNGITDVNRRDRIGGLIHLDRLIDHCIGVASGDYGYFAALKLRFSDLRCKIKIDIPLVLEQCEALHTGSRPQAQVFAGGKAILNEVGSGATRSVARERSDRAVRVDDLAIKICDIAIEFR